MTNASNYQIHCLNLQSLMIASIPNIIGWLFISFAKVSLDHFNFFSIYLSSYYPDNLTIKFQKTMLSEKSLTLRPPVFKSFFEDEFTLINNITCFDLSGFFFSLYGKIVGRIWRRNNILHGRNFKMFSFFLVCD